VLLTVRGYVAHARLVQSALPWMLGLAGLIQLYALVAWDAADYARLT